MQIALGDAEVVKFILEQESHHIECQCPFTKVSKHLVVVLKIKRD
jgi:hypothetical protein